MANSNLSLSGIIRRLDQESPEKWVPESYTQKDWIHIDLSDRKWVYDFKFGIKIEEFFVNLLGYRRKVGLLRREKEIYEINIYDPSYGIAEYGGFRGLVASFQGAEIKRLFDKVHGGLREYWKQEDKRNQDAAIKKQQGSLNRLGEVFG